MPVIISKPDHPHDTNRIVIVYAEADGTVRVGTGHELDPDDEEWSEDGDETKLTPDEAERVADALRTAAAEARKYER